jgi:membrane protease YdiL (CAAX protease family)
MQHAWKVLMSIEPEFLPPQVPPSLASPMQSERPLESSSETYFGQPPAPAKTERPIPHLGHTVLLLIVVGGVLFLTEIAIFAIVAATHAFGTETPQQMLREPRLLIPSMAISYILAGAISWAIFTNLWGEPFPLGVRWNSLFVRRSFFRLLSLGILLSATVQLLSNYLPIPKTLPIDDFFRTPADIWLVAIFGTFLAPPFEELIFRGFMLPSFATAWDWTMRRKSPDPTATDLFISTGGSLLPQLVPQAGRDPHWSPGALVFSSVVTSIFFAMVHADQLAHSWVPLSILFTVSIVLCLVRLPAHSLAASALVHSAYNASIFVAIFIATDGFRHLDKINQ